MSSQLSSVSAMLQERNTTARTALLGQTQPQAAGWHAPVHGPVLVPWIRDACSIEAAAAPEPSL